MVLGDVLIMLNLCRFWSTSVVFPYLLSQQIVDAHTYVCSVCLGLGSLIGREDGLGPVMSLWSRRGPLKNMDDFVSRAAAAGEKYWSHLIAIIKDWKPPIELGTCSMTWWLEPTGDQEPRMVRFFFSSYLGPNDSILWTSRVKLLRGYASPMAQQVSKSVLCMFCVPSSSWTIHQRWRNMFRVFFFGSYYFRRRILWCILFPLSVIFFLSSLWFLECSEKRKKKPRERLIRVSDLTLCSFPNLKILMGKPTSKAKTVVPHRPESRLVPCDRLVWLILSHGWNVLDEWFWREIWKEGEFFA